MFTRQVMDFTKSPFIDIPKTVMDLTSNTTSYLLSLGFRFMQVLDPGLPFPLSLPSWSSDRRPMNALALSRTYHRSMPYSVKISRACLLLILRKKSLYRKRGIARKKRENLHRLASTNRSFAHFRWW